MPVALSLHFSFLFFSSVLMMLLFNDFLLFKSKNFILKTVLGDFPGYPVEKNLPSKAGGECLILGGGTKIPHAWGSQTLLLQLGKPAGS